MENKPFSGGVDDDRATVAAGGESAADAFGAGCGLPADEAAWLADGCPGYDEWLAEREAEDELSEARAACAERQ